MPTQTKQRPTRTYPKTLRDEAEQRKVWAIKFRSIGLPHAAELITSLEGDSVKNTLRAMCELSNRIDADRQFLADISVGTHQPLLDCCGTAARDAE